MVLDAHAFAIAGEPEEDTTVVAFPTPGDSRDSIATIRRLSAAMLNRASDMTRFDAYYRGDHGLRFASSKYRKAFGEMFGKYAENFCGLVVDAVEERLDVEGFTYPAKEAEAGDPQSEPAVVAGEADRDAWRIWQDNQLDAGSQIAHTEALVKGVSYVLVSPLPADKIAGRSPRITVEDPLQTIVEYAPGTRERLVGMKRWSDPTERKTFATLYFPNRIEKWQSASWRDQQGTLRAATGRFASGEQWEHRIVPDEPWPLQHSLGVVPLVPLVNKPRLLGEGESEIAQIIPIQDAINKLAIDGLIASDTSAFRQKWATGIEIPLDPDTGKPIEAWKFDQERILSSAVPDAKFGNFEATELANYSTALDQKVTSIASITRTPYHYFLRHGGQPPSGESLKSSETGLVRKARRKQRHFGEGWEEVMSLAFRVLGDPRGEVLDSQTDWANPESMTEAEHVDALTKLRSSLHVPLKQLWKDNGYTPGEIAGFRAALEEEREWLNSQPVATTQPATPPGPQLSITRPDGSVTSIRSVPMAEMPDEPA